MVGVFLAPESPWWLVRQGREKDAVAALKRLTSKADTDFNPDETVAMMIHTNELEKEIEEGTTYLDCFKGVDLRRTEVVCFTWAAQNLCGAGIMGYSTYFQAGDQFNSINLALAWRCVDSLLSIWPVELNHRICKLNWWR
jgi:SP family general alpha glucoside:H+ symporter-like MFS transporter